MASRASFELTQHYRVLQCMRWDEGDEAARGEFWVLMLNVFTACTLEAMRRQGLRIGAMHVNAQYLSLIKRLTRALDAATDPFDSTEASRAMLRVEWGL